MLCKGVVQYIDTGDRIYSILNMLYPYDVSVVDHTHSMDSYMW